MNGDSPFFDWSAPIPPWHGAANESEILRQRMYIPTLDYDVHFNSLRFSVILYDTKILGVRPASGPFL